MRNNVLQLYAKSVADSAAARGAHPPAMVHRQANNRQVEIANGSDVAIGAWLLCGQDQIGICRGHRNGRAIVELVYEQVEERWGAVRTAARIGSHVVPLPPELWEDLYDQLYLNSFPVGRVRQAGLRIRARVPELAGHRTLVAGKTRSGKSTAIVSMIVAHRSALDARQIPNAARPAVLIFDPHGDYVGRVLERDGRARRPNALQCLEEEPVVLGAGSLVCRVRDLPPPLIVDALGKLSPAQKVWADRYMIDDDDHSGIEHLLFEKFEPAWPELFRDLSTNGVMREATKESLKTLRSRMRSLFTAPLFTFDPESSWAKFFDHVYSGRVIIVDVKSYPAPQQTLVMALTILAIQRHQHEAQIRGRRLKQITLVADELHEFPGVFERLNAISRGGGKYGVGLLLGTQRIADFSDDILTQASCAVLMRLEGPDIRSAIARWPAIRAVEAELDRLASGDGFVVVDNTPWPVHFDEPPFSAPGLSRRPPEPPK